MGEHNSKTVYCKTMDKESCSQFPLKQLPDDLLVDVFIRVPSRDLAKSCAQVCKRWNALIKTQQLWKDKCIRRYQFPCDVLAALSGVLHADFKLVYFLNPYNRNLVRNADASKGLHEWNVLKRGGDGFKVEPTPIGCYPVTEYAASELKGKTVGCWSTSFIDCFKEQVIDLIKEGCSVEVLDHVRPDIIVSEWYAARFDCGVEYEIDVQLLSDLENSRSSIVQVFVFKDTKHAGQEWFNLKHTFSDYKPGVRYIKFVHGGRDTQFWAGHYGVKITLSSVRFDLNHTAGPEMH